MKKILFATTALVATAGVASAEVAVSGYAEMGLSGTQDTPVQYHTDVDVTFEMSGEADSGLSFGTAVDLDESVEDDAFDASDDGGVSIYIAYDAAKLTMGDTDGAFDAALNEAIIGSSIGDNHEHAGYNGNSGFDGTHDDQIATFEYGFEGFTGYLSAEISDTGYDEVFNPVPGTVWGVGAKYSVELASLTVGVGVGLQGYDDNTIWGFSADTTFNNGVQAIFNYSSKDVVGDELVEHIGLALGYTWNEINFGVNYGVYLGGEVGEDYSEGIGLAAGYDLGGGLEAQFGYGYGYTVEDDIFQGDDETWSLGLAMSF